MAGVTVRLRSRCGREGAPGACSAAGRSRQGAEQGRHGVPEPVQHGDARADADEGRLAPEPARASQAVIVHARQRAHGHEHRVQLRGKEEWGR